MIWIVNDHGDCIHASEFESSSYQRLRIQYDEFPPLAVKSLTTSKIICNPNEARKVTCEKSTTIDRAVVVV